ncbi:expressed hypothetical protein [Trichoplax adhaerens]|uniref:Uncharacterized protein n=1 Tax=Trichoplax adhaerens TaxID=10228 RepID=B3SA87_TRIAD|nr:expressed hypothetical protein [Trichoplax adhaerens]EDV20472.1 expressed hypothetical protein [Trichoplax adhaerens]|eukprot:XP_002117166.1 expressed hypothetical protein [Trichoplax adhaerens]
MANPNQPQAIHQPQQTQQVVYQTCCSPIGKTLTPKMQTVATAIGITMLINGIISLTVGIVGFFTTSSYYNFYHPLHSVARRTSIIYHYYNLAVYIGPNIWVGIPYILCGIFGIVSQKNRINHHLVNSFFAFSIISFILSIFHFGISLGTMFDYHARYSIWFNIVSILTSIAGFSLALTCIIILGHHIYCGPSHNHNAITVYYQGAAAQPVTIQQYPGQIATGYPAGQPVYMQAVAMPQTSMTTKVPIDQVAQPPQYANFQPSTTTQIPASR